MVYSLVRIKRATLKKGAAMTEKEYMAPGMKVKPNQNDVTEGY
jgi:hypothetical protein